LFCTDRESTRTRIIGKNLITLAVALLALPLYGCDTQPAEADFKFISPSAHHYLDPQKMSWSHDIRIIDCLFEPLVRVSADTRVIEPAAAQRWDISNDGLTYTFHLRPTAKWSNGDPVTAGDFIYAWRRAMLPDLAADYTQLMFAIQGAQAFFGWRNQQLTQYADGPSGHSPQAAHRLWQLATQRFTDTVGLAAPNEQTLVVHLARPIPYFLELCAFATFMPVHTATLESHTSLHPSTGMQTTDPTWTKPKNLVNNGPYILKQWKFKRFLQLVANEHYWNRGAMRNHSIMELIVTNPQTALLKYDNGEVDWLPDIPTTKPIAADLIQSNRPDVHTSPAAGTYFYNFNCKPRLNDGTPNPLADPRLRRALSMAIDRNTIVQKVTRLGDQQPVALTFIPPNTLKGYAPPIGAGTHFDPEAARGLLAQAGHPNGQGLTHLSILYNSEGGHAMIAQQIKRSWKTHLNISVKLEAVESNNFSERLKNQDYTICRASWFGDYHDPTTFLDKFLTGNGNNDCAWSNPEYDRIMQQAAAQRNPAQRTKLLQRAETLMLREQPIAPIYHYINLWLYDPDRVQGLTLNPWKILRLERVRVLRRP